MHLFDTFSFVARFWIVFRGRRRLIGNGILLHIHSRITFWQNDFVVPGVFAWSFSWQLALAAILVTMQASSSGCCGKTCLGRTCGVFPLGNTRVGICRNIFQYVWNFSIELSIYEYLFIWNCSAIYMTVWVACVFVFPEEGEGWKVSDHGLLIHEAKTRARANVSN